MSKLLTDSDMKKEIINKKTTRAIFIIPFYDKDIEQLFDTIESIKYFIKEPYSIICVNDCKNSQNIKLFEKKIASENIINFVPYYESTWPHNTFGSLFCKKYQAMEYALQHFNFNFIINMDTDALVTGCNLFDYVSNYFAKNPEVGIIGSYKTRSDGKKRTRWEWALYLLYLRYIVKQIPKESLLWKEWIPVARENGYKLGEHILGGAFISSYIFVKNMIDLCTYNLMLKNKIYLINIGDDVIFSLLAFASGFKIGDFGRPDDPLAIAQKFLPISKEEVIRKSKQLIHSTKKGLNGESEEELRAYFRSFRK